MTISELALDALKPRLEGRALRMRNYKYSVKYRLDQEGQNQIKKVKIGGGYDFLLTGINVYAYSQKGALNQNGWQNRERVQIKFKKDNSGEYLSQDSYDISELLPGTNKDFVPELLVKATEMSIEVAHERAVDLATFPNDEFPIFVEVILNGIQLHDKEGG